MLPLSSTLVWRARVLTGQLNKTLSTRAMTNNVSIVNREVRVQSPLRMCTHVCCIDGI